MSDHLPECYCARPSQFAKPCICDRLRACEQRLTRTLNDHYWELGVQAARAIVADSPTAAPTDDYRLLIRREAALAAIDALGETGGWADGYAAGAAAAIEAIKDNPEFVTGYMHALNDVEAISNVFADMVMTTFVTDFNALRGGK